ncbi:MAG: LPS export ABC transporter periplasmic protein LptC [Leptolyngbyaceae cyanobacterium RM2_2_21]|nr:LPS export ABC transporter periplasmic protein LptC [Leptolyngbyaceae cyanobacterium RM2_2_21]
MPLKLAPLRLLQLFWERLKAARIFTGSSAIAHEAYSMKKWYRLAGVVTLIAVVLGSIRAYQLVNQEPLATSSSAADETAESGLTLKDVTLEQPDEDGNLLWRVHADEVTYSPDQKVAVVTNPDGELFQDGEPIYRVKADRGEVRQDGESIFFARQYRSYGCAKRHRAEGARTGVAT